MSEPFKLILKSFRDLKANPILFVPVLLGIALLLALAAFAALQIGLGLLTFRLANTTAAILAASIFVLLDIVLIVVISAYVKAAQYGVLVDITVLGKSSFSRLISHGKKYFFPVLTYSLALLTLLAIPAVAMLAILLIISMASPVAALILAIPLAIIFTILLVAMSVLLIFWPVIVVSKNLRGITALKDAFDYGKSHLEHTIITFAILFLMGVTYSVIYTALYLPALLAEMSLQAGGHVSLVGIAIIAFFRLASIALSIVFGVFTMLFIFNSYFDKNKIKNWK